MFAQLDNLIGCKWLKRFLYVVLISGLYSGHVCLRPGYIHYASIEPNIVRDNPYALKLSHREGDNLRYEYPKHTTRKPSRRIAD